MDKLAQTILDDAKNSVRKIDFSGLKNKSILITGASGLVGTYLLAGLVNIPQKNHPKKIYAVCQSKPEKHWEAIADSLSAAVVRGDLCDDPFADALPKADVIIHASGYAQPGKFMAAPLKTFKLNTAVTLKLLEKLQPKGKFLFISSSEVYSGLTRSPFTESQIGTTNTDHPRSCYIEGKRGGEAIVYAARGAGIDAKSARLSLAYGPGTRKDDKRALHSFINRALTEKKIELMDSGEALRTYCYITDATQLMWHILLQGKDNVYNVGGTSRTSIAKLARLIGKILNVPVIIPRSKKQALAAPEDVRLDLTKTRKEFGKQKFVSFEDGMKKTVAWQKELHERNI